MQWPAAFLVKLALPSGLDEDLDAVKDPAQAEDEFIVWFVGHVEDPGVDECGECRETLRIGQFASAAGSAVLFIRRTR
jgi:hypothetical protein